MLFAAALASATLLGVSGGATPGSPPPRWFGVAFGSAVVSYRPLLGDPLQITSAPDERKARFSFPAAPHAFLIVSERRGAVTGIEAFVDAPPAAPLTAVEADPGGVRLGATYDTVAAARPAARRWVDNGGNVHLRTPADDRGIVADYRFAAERLVADDWFAPQERDGPQIPGAIPYGEPAGDGETTAIVDVQANEHDGVDWEALYLRYHPCDGTTPWHRAMQSTRTTNGRVYDVLDTTCPTTGVKRAFYFDITSFYGKL